jgi:hypothetical protein
MRGIRWVQVALVGAAVVVGGLIGLVTNVASDQETWPGPLRWVQDQPWRAALGLLVVAVVVAVVVELLSQRQSRPGSDAEPPSGTGVTLTAGRDLRAGGGIHGGVTAFGSTITVISGAAQPTSSLSAALPASSPAPPVQTALTGHLVAQVWNIPQPVRTFSGREAELGRLLERFKATPRAALVTAAALYGMGGIGKTQLARAFAHRHRDRYRVGLVGAGPNSAGGCDRAGGPRGPARQRPHSPPTRAGPRCTGRARRPR